MDTTLTNKIRRGEIDVNNRSLFFSILIKALMLQLKKELKIRDIPVPHFILNTGDDTMYLGVKSQNQAIEPKEVSNENFVYNTIPRCIVEPKGISLVPNELTSPYSKGKFELDYDNQLTTFVAEFRRYPLTLSVDLTYYTDSYTDMLELTQQIITKLAFIKTFDFTYMGQHIKASYVIPEGLDNEYDIQLEGTTTERKERKMNLSLTVETYIPVYDVHTVMQADHYIQKTVYETYNKGQKLSRREV